jgi:pimeloyl-ACP methyl ester carboxylesterase
LNNININYYVIVWLLYALMAVYIAVKIAFYIAFSMYFVPRANELTEPPPYRDYQRDRTKLLLRIVKRIENSCSEEDNTNEDDVQRKIVNFLAEWFQVRRRRDNDNTNNKNSEKLSPSRLSSDVSAATTSTSPSSSPENSDTENYEDEPVLSTIRSTSTSTKENDDDDANEEDDDEEVLPVLSRTQVDGFFGWAFFGKRVCDMLPWEQEELNRLYVELEQETGVSFPTVKTATTRDNSNNNSNNNMKKQHQQHDDYDCTPRCLSLERVNALYRPLFIYGFVILLKVVAGVFLYTRGFRRYTSKTGLVGWFRPAQNPTNAFLPTIFFHGIAPAGHAFYLPMVLFGLAPERDRPVFLFENPSISCCLDFYPLTEEQTVDGVVEILKRTDCFDKQISLIGHSFGSCPVTWLVMSKKIPTIQQVTLLDPVAIMLSEPDVMVNFLYAEELDKIRMVASSELFTEYYLRRHFAWYNSELWLEDVVSKKNCNILVCLSEDDEIVNTPKVSREMKRMKLDKEHNLVVWPKVGHAACVTRPSMWKQIKERMMHQELQVLQKPKQE